MKYIILPIIRILLTPLALTIMALQTVWLFILILWHFNLKDTIDKFDYGIYDICFTLEDYKTFLNFVWNKPSKY